MAEQSQSLLKFPCDFTIKVTGRANEAFSEAISIIIKQHHEKMTELVIEEKLSAQGNYLSFSLRFLAQNKEHLDAIYQDLSACEQVLVVL